MNNSELSRFFRYVKLFDKKEKPFYMLQGSLFDYIFTSKAEKELIELQSKFKNADVFNQGIDSLSNSLVKDDNLSAECVYWIYRGKKFVELYKLKDFKVNHNSYNFTILRLFFQIGTKFSLKKDNSVESHFVTLELLKNCLYIAENLKPTKTLRKYKIISYLFFLLQILNAFINMNKTKLCKGNKRVIDLINKFTMLSGRAKDVKIAKNPTIQKFQKYLSFLDVFCFSLVNPSDSVCSKNSSFSKCDIELMRICIL